MNSNRLHASLERHFQVVDKIILSRQDAITGLLPASTAVNAHGDYTDAWVRDNVYSILSVWGLALAYRKANPNHHRSYLLAQSVVKLMRGLLTSMMRQSDRIEAFKQTHNPTDALHAKYGTKTGLAVVGDNEWGHLQLDATSLFLLMMAQMIASGLRIVYTLDEVNFVQNLVHYISDTYCTADYGIWERGNKINHGTTEINGSSVGMAKAALEAMDGFNLFGNIASQEAVIHVILSDIARSRFTLQGLLPRESNSKETDAALLSIIGYPAYAVEDEKLLKRTRDKILKKLVGNYGCKRFLLDGHQSSIEDSTRLHYEPTELSEFKDIESEWPLFFTYLLLDALMREDREQVEHWKAKLEGLFVEQDGQRLLPELYIVPLELIEAEKANPNSQIRIPNENIPLVWAQSLYMLSDMIMDGLLEPEDIDPLNRRQRIGYKTNPISLVPILAENEAVKQQLEALGFKSETLDEVKPIRIAHANQLSLLHTMLGKNEKLALSGRPFMVARSMTTARLHLLAGEKSIFLPYYFNPQGFYFSNDNRLLVEHFRASLQFLYKQWDSAGQPIIPLLVREAMFSEVDREALIELLKDLEQGESDGAKVQTGSLHTLLPLASLERIDNINGFEFGMDEKNLTFSSLVMQQLYTSAIVEHDWVTVRRIAEETGKYDDRLEDVLLDIIIRQKRLGVGRSYSGKATFSKPHKSTAIVETIVQFCGNNSAESVLTQEIILHLGYLIRNEPELFENMLTLRTWYFIQLLVGQISRKENLPTGDAYEVLLGLAPHDIYNRLWSILKAFNQEVTHFMNQENLHVLGVSSIELIKTESLLTDSFEVENWLHWREDRGMIGPRSAIFYKDIWYLLRQCGGLVIGDRYGIENRIGTELTLESTAGERSFALSVDALLQGIHAPEYRQLNIEALESMSRIFKQNPDFKVENDLIVDVLIGHAVRFAWEKDRHIENYNEQRGEAWEAFYKLSPKETDRAFIGALMKLILAEEK